MPRYVNRLQLYEGSEPLFHKYKLEDEIAQIHQRQSAAARQGGSIVIDQTEALVAIDVNSGNFRARRRRRGNRLSDQHLPPPRKSPGSCGCAIWAA